MAVSGIFVRPPKVDGITNADFDFYELDRFSPPARSRTS